MRTDVSSLGRLAWRRPILLESVLLAAVCTLDMISTLYLIRTHLAIESNPLMVGPLEHSDAAFLLIKGATYMVPIMILELLRPVRPDLIQRALRVCLLGYLATYALGSIGLLLMR